jgi:hypothetical protein
MLSWHAFLLAIITTTNDKYVTQCSGVKLGHPVPGGYKYSNLALKVG